jgi:hypothetical protein
MQDLHFLSFFFIIIVVEVSQYIDSFCQDQQKLNALKREMILIDNFDALATSTTDIANLICPSGTIFDGT